MTPKEKRRPIIVGLFILLAIIIFVAGVLTLGGQQKRFVSSIRLYAIFDNVEGLKPGNNVWFSGVKIGTVKHINFYGDSEVEIEMSIEEASQPYIRKDAKARLSSESFIGNKIIEIVGGTKRAGMANNGDTLASAQVLGTTEIMETAQANNKNLLSITTDLRKISAMMVKGQGTMGMLFTDSLVATDIRSAIHSLQQTARTTQGVAASLAQFTAKLNRKDGLVNDLLTDTAMFGKIEKAVAELNHTLATASALTENLNQTSQKLNKTDNPVGVLLNDEQAAAQLKTTLKNLETGSAELNKTLKALQNSFLLRGYFKKQNQ